MASADAHSGWDAAALDARPALPLAVYTPDSVLRRPGALLRQMLTDLWGGRELAWRLAVRDISALYRQAALGIGWAFLLPVANTLIWVGLQAGGVISGQATGMPHVAFVFAGAMLWAIFMDAAQAPLRQMEAAKGLLTKIQFPREALFIAGVYLTFFNAAIRLLVTLPVLWWLGAGPDSGLALFPLLLVLLVLAGTVLGLALVPIGVLYTDVGKALPLLLQLLMFLSPVVFVAPAQGWLARVHALNPLTPLLVNARNLLAGQPLEMLPMLLGTAAAFLALLLAAWVAFRIAVPIVVERIGS